MSSFIEETLLPNERVIYRTHPHWIIFAPTLGWIFLWCALSAAAYYYHVAYWVIMGPYNTLSVLNFVALITIGIYGLIASIQYWNSEYGVTTKRVLIKVGFISRASFEIFLNKIESIQVYQSVPGRLFDYGSIVIIGTGGTQDIFHNIPSPLLFRQKAQIQAETTTERHNDPRQ